MRIGIIGLGYWGPNLLRNFAAQPEGEVVWGCDLSEANLAKAQRHYPALRVSTKIDDLIADPSLELIIIATPTIGHAPIAKAALLQGKHVFVEKPMARTVQEAEELVYIAHERKKFLMVDHTFVFAPAVQTIANTVHDGRLGNLLYFDSVRINLGLLQKDCNVLWDLAIHDLSIISTFKDLATARSVTAHGSKHFGSQIENAHLHITFADGFEAHIHCSWLSPVKIRQTILAGTKAMITYDDTHPSEKVRIYDKGVERDTSKPDPFFPKYRAGEIRIPALPGEEPLAREAAHVLRCVRGDEQPMVTGTHGLNIVRILEASDVSLQRGSVPVMLP